MDKQNTEPKVAPSVEMPPLDEFISNSHKLIEDFAHQTLDLLEEKAAKMFGKFVDDAALSIQSSIRKIDARPLLSVGVALGVGCVVGIVLGIRFPQLGQQSSKQLTRNVVQ